MKTNLSLAFLLCLMLIAPCSAADLPQWSFVKAADMLGWQPNDTLGRTETTAQGLRVERAGSDASISIGGLNIDASAGVYVEIEVSTTQPGNWELFWAVDESGPYRGFSQARSTTFHVPAGQSVRGIALPGWESEQQPVSKLRLDPPDGTAFTLRTIALKQQPGTADASASWSFPEAASGWQGAGLAAEKRGAGAWSFRTASQTSQIESPVVRVKADERTYVVVEMSVDAGEQAALEWRRAAGVTASRLFAVRADGQRHIYNVDLTDEPAWAGTVVALSLRPTDAAGANVQVHRVAVSDAPSGPGDVDIESIQLAETLARAGARTPVRVQIRNSGGQTLRDVRISLAADGIAVAGAPQTVDVLEPGQSTEVVFQVTAERAGQHSLRATATYADKSSAANGFVVWAPELPEEFRPTDGYIPAPRPVETGDIDVGAYYFPGWESHMRWAVLDEFPERRPVLGYYLEGDPEVADWHTKWALEHGISFWVYDWYWTAGKRSLEHALHDGFFKSRFQSMMKFCLLWANHNPAGTSSYEDMEAVTRYWIDNYFKRDNYYTIDGKPVIIIFDTRRFREDMGTEGTRRALDRAREMCREAGLPGLYFMANTYPGREGIKLLEQERYDALTGYNYPTAGDEGRLHAPFSAMVDAYPEIWNQIASVASIPYVPVAEGGWDSRPWHGSEARVRTGKSPELFAKMLRSAKDFLNKPTTRLPVGRKMVLLEAWNEFGEGDYIEPHREWGFGYVDAVREVFAASEQPHLDLTPKDVGSSTPEVAVLETAGEWNFDHPDEGSWLQEMQGEVKDGTFRGTSVDRDPALYLPRSTVDARKNKCVEIRMRVTKGVNAQLFWSRGQGFREEESKGFKVTPDGRFHIYRLDLSEERSWSRIQRRFRLDPTDEQGAEIEIDYIRVQENCSGSAG